MSEIEPKERTKLYSLTVHERFKDARTVHNKNGKQTMDAVASATGLQKSMIHSLELDDTRGSSFRDVSKLAKHYGVSMDWLCGLTEVRTINETQRGICEKTQLSEQAVETLLDIKNIPPSFYSSKFSEEKDICTNDLIFFLNKLLEWDGLNELARAYSNYAYSKYQYNSSDSDYEASNAFVPNESPEEHKKHLKSSLRNHEMYTLGMFMDFLVDAKIDRTFFEEAEL